MRDWLTARGEDVPAVQDHHAMHTGQRMAGMASPEQMAELAAARGAEFDRLFLRLMITHHEGAVTMVERLLGAKNAVGGGETSSSFRSMSGW